MPNIISTPRGMDDTLPEEMKIKRWIEEEIRNCFFLYGYEEIETPTIEFYELFEAKSGEEIRERMFVFEDKHKRKMVLRPEMTAPVARLVATKLKNLPLPIRLGYIADCYRYDEPQWGRKRRFWHGGFELIGSDKPIADAEILIISNDIFNRLNIKNHYFKIGHVGILRSIMEEYKISEKIQDRVLSLMDQKKYEQAFSLIKEEVEGDDIRDLIKIIELLLNISGETNEVFKKGHEILSSWPIALKKLENLEEIINIAIESGVSNAFNVNLAFARGLEYYTGMIFEQYAPDSPLALNGGGRYDKLISLFGGKDTPAVGCAIGITRLQEYFISKKIYPKDNKKKSMIAFSISEDTIGYLSKILQDIRKLGIGVKIDISKKKITSIIEHYSKLGYKYLIIVGPEEKESKTISLRDLEKKEQIRIKLENLEEYIKEKLFK
jgi:histidyl-tRNA synthetase